MATILGVTGTIGSGKSYVSRQLAEHYGATVYDADAMAKEVIYGEAQAELCSRFPEWVTGGKLDPAKLKTDVLAHPDHLVQFERIVHPKVREAFLRIKRAAQAKDGFIVFEVPLLFESGFETLCDHVVAVVTSEQTQIRRALARGKMSEEQVRAVLDKQMPQDEKIRRADYVIHSEDTDDVAAQLQQMMRALGETKTR